MTSNKVTCVCGHVASDHWHGSARCDRCNCKGYSPTTARTTVVRDRRTRPWVTAERSCLRYTTVSTGCGHAG